MASPLKLPPPTICDMNCFYKPNHRGSHQFETVDEYEKRTMKDAETLILVRSGTRSDYWSRWNQPFEDVITTQEENFSGGKVNANPIEIIEVTVIRKAIVQAKVEVSYE